MGAFSASFSEETQAMGRDTFVIGACNVGLNANGGTPSANSWSAIDPAFEIGNGGNGSWAGNPALNQASDALVVYRNGNAVFQGVVQVAAGGDIPMYNGN